MCARACRTRAVVSVAAAALPVHAYMWYACAYHRPPTYFFPDSQAVDFHTRWFGQTAANALGTALGNLLGPAPRGDVTASTTTPQRRASAPSSPSPRVSTSAAAAATPTKAPAWASALRAVWVPATPLRLVRLCLRGESGARLGVAAATCVRHLAGNLSLRVKCAVLGGGGVAWTNYYCRVRAAAVMVIRQFSQFA